MNRIALQMLFGDRSKYMTMVIGLTFATLVMTQQPAILIGLLTRTYSFVQDISFPDIWVMDPGVQFVEEHKPLRDTALYRIRGISGIEWAVPIFKGMVQGKLPDGKTISIDITGIDDATLIGAPPQILEGQLSDFRRRDAIFVDAEAAQKRFAIKRPDGSKRALQRGDVMEINDHRAVVVGIVKNTRNFILQPQIVTSYSQAVSYASKGRRHLTYILVKAKDSTDKKKLIQDIQRVTGLKAYEKEEFKTVNLRYWMDNTGIPINFGISVLLGFIVGAAIVGQTFFNFVHENTRYFAALKAMGLRNWMLAKMVMLQAAVVGAIGYGLGVALTTLFGLKVHDSVLAFRMPPSLLFFAGLGVFLIISLSALLGIRRVISVDPSVIFRG